MTDRLRWVGLSSNSLQAPMVGRGRELAALEDALSEVKTSREARVVSLVGPAGIGKSRLAYEFFQGLETPDEGEEVRVFRGSARGSEDAYAMFERLLRARFGLGDGIDPEAAKSLVRAQVASVLEDRKVGDVLFFLGQLLGLPFPDSPLTKAVGEDAIEGRLVRRSVLRRLIESDAAAAPLALFFDDLDDAHHDSRELLAFLCDLVDAPVLIVCASRADLGALHEGFTAISKDRLRRVELGALGEPESVTVVEALLEPCGDVPEALVDSACAAAGGNPMLLERMIRVFVDTGVLEVTPSATHRPEWRVHLDKLDRARLPLSVEDAVEARIAALSPDERRLLERAAAMGSVFWEGGLSALTRSERPGPAFWTAEEDADAATITAALDELVERDYLLRLPDSTFAGERELVFKHNKERERIASGTSPQDLRSYHQILADWLEHKAGVRAHEEHMGMLARHRELAGARTRAALSYLEAGAIARARFAHQKAVEYYERGLSLLGSRDAGRRVDALHDHGDVLLASGHAEAALAEFEEMKTLAYRLDLPAKGGAAHNRIGRLYRDTGRLELAEPHLRAGLALFQRAGDERGIASTEDDLGKLRWMRGEYALALDSLQRGLTLRRRLGDRRGIALSMNNLGVLLQDCGEYARAKEAFEHSLSIRREIGDVPGVATSLNNLGTVQQDLGEHERALTLLGDALLAAREVGEKNRVALVLTNIGVSEERLGHADVAIKVLTEAEGLCDELGDKLGLAEVLRSLGRAHMSRRELAKARQFISRSVELFTAVRSKVHLGIAVRTLGEITAEGGWGAEHTGKARDYFLRATSIFEEIGNEIEAARTCQAFAAHVRREGGPNAEAEADALEARAASALDKLTRASLPDGWERSPPPPAVDS
ncbi:MAG: tetratricopeptide repeat protein [Polyangiaceae bacterium]|nr:tetratricopeptide repeat protein [Polyangiaceae bacterium]